MDYIKLNDAITIEINKMKETKEFKEFITLKEEINNKYIVLVNDFKNKKLKYEEASIYKEYYPGFSKIKDEYLKIKSELFSKEELKKYFVLLHLLEDKYNEILDLIKKEILL